jgi:hypothetical protein
MEARWISALIGGRAPFFVFRIKVCRGGVQVVVAVPHVIKCLRLQPHLGGNVERLVGVVWCLRILSGYGDLRIMKELHRQFFLLLRLRDRCGLLNPFGDFPSATNNVRPTQGGAAAAAHRRHGLEVEDEGLLKDLVVIFIFLGVLCIACFFNARVLFAKKVNFERSYSHPLKHR